MYTEADDFLTRKRYHEYEANNTPYEDYMRQAVSVLTKVKGMTRDQAILYTKEMMQKKQYQVPIVRHTRKNPETEDRAEDTSILFDYIKETRAKKQTIAPSFTTYTGQEELIATQGLFIDDNVRARSIIKAKMFECEQKGDIGGMLFNKDDQVNRKVSNNSMSGGAASQSTTLYNQSLHYTLTSTTRSVASISNVVSESFIASNKMFNTVNRVLDYITAVVNFLDFNLVEKAIEMFNLHLPTPEEVLNQMVLKSTRNYWIKEDDHLLILEYLSALSPIERAAVSYTNDLYMLKEFNQDLIRKFITQLISKENPHVSDPLTAIKDAPEGVSNLVHVIYMDEIRGMNVNYKELEANLLQSLGSSAYNIVKTLREYKPIFDAFFITDIIPIGVADFKDMVRECIVLSDTDSTCATYGHWVEWYFGKMVVSTEAMRVSGAIMTLNTMVIEHYVKLFSKNAGIPDSHKEKLKMKNEFLWSVFVPTNVSKHYFACVEVQEGNVKHEPFAKPEVKGVNLLSSNAPKLITDEVFQMIKDINKELSTTSKVSILQYVNRVFELEKQLYLSIYNGDTSLFKRLQNKPAEGYKEQSLEKNPYYHHIIWNESFGNYYGTMEEPPYETYKINLTISTKKQFEAWLASMENQQLASDLQSICYKLRKDRLSLIRVPIIIASNRGIPKEILPVIDIKRIVLDALSPLYMVLASIGYYKSDLQMLSESLGIKDLIGGIGNEI